MKKRKEEIRKELIEKRRKQSKEERIKKSLIIWKKLKVMPEFVQANTVMFYLSLPDEVETEKMIRESLKMGKRIVVPVVKVKERKIIPSILKNYDKELEKGTFNILEPRNKYVREISSDAIDLVIVPGVAFDRNCRRLGFGKGFYDYFLANLKRKAMFIALAYDFQVLAELPKERHDVLMDKIITEKHVIQSSKF